MLNPGREEAEHHGDDRPRDQHGPKPPRCRVSATDRGHRSVVVARLRVDDRAQAAGALQDQRRRAGSHEYVQPLVDADGIRSAGETRARPAQPARRSPGSNPPASANSTRSQRPASRNRRAVHGHSPPSRERAELLGFAPQSARDLFAEREAPSDPRSTSTREVALPAPRPSWVRKQHPETLGDVPPRGAGCLLEGLRRWPPRLEARRAGDPHRLGEHRKRSAIHF